MLPYFQINNWRMKTEKWSKWPRTDIGPCDNGANSPSKYRLMNQLNGTNSWHLLKAARRAMSYILHQ